MSLLYPSKPVPGDRVAILSMGVGLPQILPLPFELGLRRLRDDFGLIPVEYPTTRRMNATPADRAADLHAAFADDTVTAVIATIGGDDQITVLPHLDADLLRANPKPFFGYSDNTNLLAHLSSLGIVGFHGGSVMVELGRPTSMNPITERSLRAALFETTRFRLTEPTAFGDENRDWADPVTFETEPAMRPAAGWTWRNPVRRVEGHSWGGCLEIVAGLAMADLAFPEPEYFDGAVLFLETSEEMPDAQDVYRWLRGLGLRGVLGRCGALLMARPKAWSLDNRTDEAARQAYVTAQRAAVNRALDEYAPDLVAVFDVDFGHTDPQQVIPYGGTVVVDGPARTITVHY